MDVETHPPEGAGGAGSDDPSLDASHSLRHTAATHLREDLHVRDDVVGALLAHLRRGTSDATPIYLRAELLAERRAALITWACWLERCWLERLRADEPGARVLPFGV